jgi:hypothetical protein
VIEAATATPLGTFLIHDLGDTTPAGLPGGVAGSALTFANAGGVVFSAVGAVDGVVLPGQVDLRLGGTILVNGANLYEYVLMDGLNVAQSVVNAVGMGGSALDAVKAIFGNEGLVSVMGAEFQLGFSGSKLVMTQLSLSSTVPEPSVYALVGGLGALGLAVWRRRRGKLKMKN